MSFGGLGLGMSWLGHLVVVVVVVDVVVVGVGVLTRVRTVDGKSAFACLIQSSVFILLGCPALKSL